MNTDLELIKLTERFKERCQCFDCAGGEVIQEYLSKFLTVLARLFCWVDKDCTTILKAQREEIFPLTSYEICECKAFFEFRPYWYKEFDPSTLKLYLHCRQGMNRDVREIDTTKWSWDLIDGTVIVDMTEIVNPCCQCVNACCCKTEYKLVAQYEAGYLADTIPDCVIDAMCHFMNIFIAYQNNCGTIDDCSQMDRLAVGSVLKSKSVDYLIRTWEVDKESIDRLYMKLIYRWAFESLSMLSLCKPEKLSGFVNIGKGNKQNACKVPRRI